MARLYAARSLGLDSREPPSIFGGGLDGPLRYLPQNSIAPAKPALGRRGGDSRHTACARHPHRRRRRHRSHRSLYLMVRLPHRGWLLDLDGTIYVGEALVPGAVETIAALRGDGRRVVFTESVGPATRRAAAGDCSKSVILGICPEVKAWPATTVGCFW